MKDLEMGSYTRRSKYNQIVRLRETWELKTESGWPSSEDEQGPASQGIETVCRSWKRSANSTSGPQEEQALATSLLSSTCCIQKNKSVLFKVILCDQQQQKINTENLTDNTLSDQWIMPVKSKLKFYATYKMQWKDRLITYKIWIWIMETHQTTQI